MAMAMDQCPHTQRLCERVQQRYAMRVVAWYPMRRQDVGPGLRRMSSAKSKRKND